MAERDINDIIEDIFLREETAHRSSYEEGFKAGISTGNPEGYHLGYHRGAELGRELGYYLGVVVHYIQINDDSTTKYTEKILNQLTKVKDLIDSFPRTNCEDQDILAMAETIRGYNMDSIMLKVCQRLDSTVHFLNPLLPVVNCHMVEFLTKQHWEKLLPTALRESLEKLELNDAVGKFWNVFDGTKCTDAEDLYNWVHQARSHWMQAESTYCLTSNQLNDKIRAWGGDVPPQLQITQHVSNKKGYEVGVLSSVVCGVCASRGAACCVEAGGGRGALPAALAHRRRPALAIDCQPGLAATAGTNARAMQKQWRSVAGNEGQDSNVVPTIACSEPLHRFAQAYLTSETDLAALVHENFPELPQDGKILLTGLHTCGNLGPDSLRMFLSQDCVTALVNVPCCYHLLTEETDDQLFDVFQTQYGSGRADPGFPMSTHLTGYNIGRNARMLASQSAERVVTKRQIPARSLLYRAMLQIMINEHIPDHKIPEGKLKRLSKCDNFKDYFKMADTTLKLDLYDKLSESYLLKTCQSLESEWKKLVMFYLLRMCLAQVVENVILLDRLLFMLESGVSEVFIVKLFDPVLSPRCHAIVAVK